MGCRASVALDAQVVDVKRLDHLPLVGAMRRELEVKDTLDALIAPHKRNAVTVGECIEALVLTMLTGGACVVERGATHWPATTWR